MITKFRNKNSFTFKYFFNIIFLFVILIFKKPKNYIYKNKLKVCICSIGKKENIYIKEFVDHYKKIGYNKIFLYDNNDINDERFEYVIQNEVNEGFVSIINYRGCIACQHSSYRDCYEKNNFKYDWLSFFDIDEYLEFKKPNLKIQGFLGNIKFRKCQNVKINWIYYFNVKNNLYYENKPLQKRIREKIRISRVIKSTVRGQLPINYWTKMLDPHSSLLKFISCSSSGKIIDYKSSLNDPPDIRYAYLKHYHYKSFEEFCYKLKRGKADSYNKNLKKKIIKFIKKNKHNKKKLNIMKKIFNLEFK